MHITYAQWSAYLPVSYFCPPVQKRKCVCLGNTKITHCRPNHDTMRKSHRTLTVTRYQKDKVKKELSLSLRHQGDCNTRMTKYWLTKQGPNTKPQQTMGTTINNESKPPHVGFLTIAMYRQINNLIRLTHYDETKKKTNIRYQSFSVFAIGSTPAKDIYMIIFSGNKIGLQTPQSVIDHDHDFHYELATTFTPASRNFKDPSSQTDIPQRRCTEDCLGYGNSFTFICT